MNKNKKEIILKGGQSTESVSRIGDEVYRTKSSNFKFIHAVLLYLESKEFPFSPRFLGIDKRDREILSFIEGEVPREVPLSFQQKIDAIKILKKFHDLFANSSLSGTEETVCHNDFAPWNVIVNNGVVNGVIDFDEASPGNRVDDVSYFIWTFLDLGNPELSDSSQIEQVVGLFNAYSLLDGKHFVPAILKQQKRILEFRHKVVQEDSDPSKRKFSKNAIKKIEHSIQWVLLNKIKIDQALSLK